MPSQDPYADLGPPMSHLAIEDRYAKIPEGFQVEGDPLKDHSGIFVGRKREIQRITRYFGDRWLAEEQGAKGATASRSQAFAHVITNAPGAGKSTLLTEIALRMSLRGVLCPILLTQHFESEETLVTELHRVARSQRKRQLMDYLREPLQAALDYDDLGRLVGGGLALSGEVVSGMIAKETIPALQKTARRLQKAFGRSPPDSLVEALELLSKGTDGRFIILVDEGQEWLGLSKRARLRVRKNIKQITDVGHRKGRNIRGGGLLLAGLGSLARSEDELGLTRAGTTWLGPLALEDSALAIAKAINSTRISSERKRRVREPWSAQLSGDFSTWAQHTAAAMAVVRDLLEATDRGKSEGTKAQVRARDAEQLEWARTMTARAVVDLYSRRMDASEKATTGWTAPIMAALSRLHNKRIPKEVVYEALATISAHDRRRRGNRRLSVDEMLRRTMHTGVLRYAVGELDLTTDTEYLELGMPSLGRYVYEKLDQEVPGKMKKAEQRARALTQRVTDEVWEQTDEVKK